MGPTRVNRKLSNECFESGEEQIKGYGKVTQNTEIFSTKYGNNISEVGSRVIWIMALKILLEICFAELCIVWAAVQLTSMWLWITVTINLLFVKTHMLDTPYPYTFLAPVPLSIIRSNSKFDENSECSSFEYTGPITTIFAHVTTVTLSWRGQNIVVIG